jgi:hypothetical protein
MYHKQGDFFDNGVSGNLLPGGMGHLPGTENQHIRAAKLLFDAPLLAGKHFQSNAQGFCRLNIFPVQTVHAAYQYRAHINSSAYVT